MLRRVGERCAFCPACRGGINIVVQLACEFGLIGFWLNQNRFVRVRPAPVCGLHIARAVGKMDLNREPLQFKQRRFHAHGNRIRRRIANGFNLDGFAVKFEITHYLAVPQIQRL
jgi:hypothetical protein